MFRYCKWYVKFLKSKALARYITMQCNSYGIHIALLINMSALCSFLCIIRLNSAFSYTKENLQKW